MQKGERVLFARYAGTKLQVGGDEHVVLSESDVLGVKGSALKDLKPLEVRLFCLLCQYPLFLSFHVAFP
jgi:hypothetical protein